MTQERVTTALMVDPQCEAVSMFCIRSAGTSYAIPTTGIEEVLDQRRIRRVPLTPSYIAGLIPYRGEVLVTVSLRALLGHGREPEEATVLVLEDAERKERFGLAVDIVDGVMSVNRGMLESSPSTLDSRTDMIFAGLYQTSKGCVVHLDPRRLLPSRLDSLEL